MRHSLIVFFLILSFSVMWSSAQGQAPFDGIILRVLSHDSFAFTEAVIAEFESETGIVVEIIRVGDTGSLVNQAILTKNNPLADVLYGVDNTFLGRALDAELFIPYQSPLLDTVSESFLLDNDYFVTPIDFGDVAINYDIGYFEEQNLAPPTSLEDLTEPEYANLLVVQNPATSSPGLAFLLSTIAAFGDDGGYSYLDYWQDLVENGVLVVEDWTTAYYGEFSLSGGERR